MLCRKLYSALFRLALCDTHIYIVLNAVIHTVPYKVHKRIVKIVNYALVNLCCFTLKHKLSFFIELYLHIADNSAHLLEYACKRYHSDRHNRILKLICKLSELSCSL